MREHLHWSSLSFLILSSISSSYTWIQEAAFGFIVPIDEGYIWTQEYFIFDDFHSRSNFQIFEAVPLTLTVWSLYDLLCISMRLRRLDIVWIVFYENLYFSLKLIWTILCASCFRCLNEFQDVLIDDLCVLTWLYGSWKHV